MHLASLLASIDSLIVAAALSAAIPRRHVLPLILLFAACDGAGSAIGAALGLDAPRNAPLDAPWAGGGLLSAMALVAWGALVLLGASRGLRLCASSATACWLPPLLAIDNVLAGGAEPAIIAGLSSGLMAAAGFAAGALLLKPRDAISSAPPGVAGIPLLVGGLLLACGV
jgi:hypothetical protein